MCNSGRVQRLYISSDDRSVLEVVKKKKKKKRKSGMSCIIPWMRSRALGVGAVWASEGGHATQVPS